MNIKKLFSFKVKDLFTLKKLGYLLGVLALATLVVFGIRSCGSERQKGKNLYFIGRDPSLYPLQLFGKERSILAFSNDLLSEIAAEAHVRLEWVDTSASLLMQGLDNGHYDAAITSLRPNIVNEEKYIFSEMYLELGPVLVLRKNSSVANLKEMQKHTIGVNSGLSLIFNAVRETGANIYALTFVTYESDNKVLEALVKGQIDAAIIPAVPAYTLIQSFYSDTLRVASAPIADEGLRLVALKSERSQVLIKGFDQALEKLISDGTFKKFIAKWNLINPAEPKK